jgi:L-amino acid N-acyltransferase YncA
MSVIIRPSSDDDVAVIAPIYVDSVLTGTASWEYVPPTVEEFAARRQHILSQGYPYLVAEVNHQAVGYAYASSYRARIGYRFTVEDSVYVATEWQGKGIGKLLLQALITECLRRDYHAMIAVIGDSQNIGSIKLHAACGFTHIGTFPNIGYKFERWLDSVQMCLQLVE